MTAAAAQRVPEQYRPQRVERGASNASASRPVLPNVDRASVDRRKFANYSMDPAADNEGKWKAWRDLGYDVYGGREAATDDLTRQIRAQLPTAPASRGPRTEWGQKYQTSFLIVGPNGKRATRDDMASRPRQ